MKKIIVLLCLTIFFVPAFCPPLELFSITQLIPTKLLPLFFTETEYKNINVWCPKLKVWAHGPGGILLTTARQMGFKGPETDLNKPEISIPLCVKYYNWLMCRYNDNVIMAVSYYKTGHPDSPVYYERVKYVAEKFKVAL